GHGVAHDALDVSRFEFLAAEEQWEPSSRAGDAHQDLSDVADGIDVNDIEAASTLERPPKRLLQLVDEPGGPTADLYECGCARANRHCPVLHSFVHHAALGYTRIAMSAPRRLGSGQAEHPAHEGGLLIRLSRPRQLLEVHGGR